MNILDSSGWLEFFTDGPNADHFSHPLQDTSNLLVPTICIYEVFKVVMRERREDDALQAIALMRQGKLVNLTSEIALQAAKNSLEHNIPMTDSIVLTTAQYHDASVWTQDEDFKGMKGVHYFPKKIRKKV